MQNWYSQSAAAKPLQWVKDLAATFKSSFPREADGFLEERGWQLKASQGYEEMAKAYARGMPWNTDLSLNGATFKADDYTTYMEAFAIKH